MRNQIADGVATLVVVVVAESLVLTTIRVAFWVDGARDLTEDGRHGRPAALGDVDEVQVNGAFGLLPWVQWRHSSQRGRHRVDGAAVGHWWDCRGRNCSNVPCHRRRGAFTPRADVVNHNGGPLVVVRESVRGHEHRDDGQRPKEGQKQQQRRTAHLRHHARLSSINIPRTSPRRPRWTSRHRKTCSVDSTVTDRFVARSAAPLCTRCSLYRPLYFIVPSLLASLQVTGTRFVYAISDTCWDTPHPPYPHISLGFSKLKRVAAAQLRFGHKSNVSLVLIKKHVSSKFWG